MTHKPNNEANKLLFGVENPVALVTGSGVKRVGRTVAETLRSAGFRVVIHAYRSINDAEKCIADWSAEGTEASLIVGDVSDEGQIQRWREEIVSRYGRLDVLVNSSAVWDPTPLESTTSEDYQDFFRVNALGTALMCQHFGLLMTKQPMGGAIINIGDWSTIRPYRDFTPYFTSKSAVVGITESMAVELASRNPKVRVNAIMPGPVMLATEIDDARRQMIIRECLLQREGSPEDVANACLFLATSPFITGVCLPVDGGRSIYAGKSADPIAHPKVR
jgi:pteridine reductase